MRADIILNEDLLNDLKDLKIEAQMPIKGHGGSTGYVKRKRRDSYVFFADHTKSRARWGNAKEIAKDIEHFQEYGNLPSPAPSNQQWGMGG